MSISAQEQQVRLQFLEEAQDYVEQIETGLLGIGSGEVKGKQLDAVMRAAHSIKGGAAMMGFMKLSAIGHRLEDSLKVLRYGQKSDQVNGQLEQDLLAVVDRVRTVINYNRQGAEIPVDWFANDVETLLTKLYDQLGEPQAADDGFFGDDEEEDDIVVYLFETEVDAAIQHLEDILASGDHSTLYSELEITVETLNGLAEMIELPAMAALCQDIGKKLVTTPEQFLVIAQMAVAAWRRSQSLVQIDQRDNLPTAIDAVPGVVAVIGSPAMEPELTSNQEFALIDTLVPVAGADELELVALNFGTEQDFVGLSLSSEESGELDFFSAMVRDSVTEDQSDSLVSDGFFSDNLVAGSSGTTGAIEELFSIEELSNLSEALPASVAGLAASGSLPTNAAPEMADLLGTITEAPLGEPAPANEVAIDWMTMQTDVDSNDFLAASTDFETGEVTEALIDWSSLNGNLNSLLASLNINESNNAVIETTNPETIDPEESSPEEFNINNSGIAAMDWSAMQNDVNADDFFGALAAAETNLSIPDPADNYAEPEYPIRPEPETYDNTPVLPEQTIRVGVERLAEIGDLFGELNISRSGLNLQVSSIRALLAALLEKVGGLEAASIQLRNAYDRISVQVTEKAIIDDATVDFDRLEMDRYGDFHLLSQSVIESVVQIQEKVSDIEIQLNDTETVTRDINRTARQMQTRFTTVRMLPLSEIIGRYPRALREMAIEHGKEVELKMKGSNLLIERHTIEVLKDPLMHLFRNCFDHGIEPASERIAAGKSPVGLIEINAFYRGNQIIIVVKDDGKGIDVEKIRAKALKMGIDEEILAAGGRQELLELIFEPGFSTAAKVTDLSGRGVGMDVVRTNLREAKGNIHIDTVAGQGSTFTITVPFTMSMMKVMIAEANKMFFAFPVNGVEEMLLPDPEKISERDGERYLQWQDAQVKLIGIKDCFQATSNLRPLTMPGNPKIDQPAILVVADGKQLFGLEIDRFWQEQEVTVRQPQGVLEMPDGISGCGVLGDGRVVPLVDPLALVRWRENAGSDINLALAPPLELSAVQNDQDLILVVDDSINVRRFVAMTLERNGYRVEEAKDGLDALEKVQAGLIPQAVICDLEMPRMDGYGFLANVKSIDYAKHVPVLMLTSRSSQKHRKIAMNLGASAYFGKPFSETEILTTLKDLIIDSSIETQVVAK
jgi:two-component system, chemotaxis family, sensor histidine kinase and response regulator PixL